MKQATLQAGEEIASTLCTTTSEQNDCTVLYERTVLCALDVITFNGISTQINRNTCAQSCITNIMTVYTQFTYIDCTK